MKLYLIIASLAVGFSAAAASAESASSASACTFWRGAMVNAWPAQREGFHSARRDRTPAPARLDCFRCLHPLCSSRSSRTER